MNEFFTLNMAIRIADRWFLPFQQYNVIGTEVIPLVDHETRSGWPIVPDRIRSLHYIVERDGVSISVPEQAGVVLDFAIPEEFVNRYRYQESLYCDNITDYIKAAAEYLNIEIRFRPETAKWYRDSLPKEPKAEDGKVGEKQPKETRLP